MSYLPDSSGLQSESSYLDLHPVLKEKKNNY